MRRIPDDASCIRFSPDGRILACSDARDNWIRIWDVRSGRLKVKFLPPRALSINCFAFSLDGTTLAMGGGGSDSDAQRVFVYDAKTWKLRRALVYSGQGLVQGVACSPNGSMIAAMVNAAREGVTRDNLEVLVWSLPTGKRLCWKVATEGDVPGGSVFFTRDGQGVVCGSHMLNLRDIKSKLRQVAKSANAWCLGPYSLDGRYALFARGWSPDSVQLLDVHNGRNVRSWKGTGNIEGGWTLFEPRSKMLITQTLDTLDNRLEVRRLTMPNGQLK